MPTESLIDERLLDAALAGDEAAVRTAVAQNPDAPHRSIHVAAAVADAEAVDALLAADSSLAERRGGQREWTALLYLCCARHGLGNTDAMDTRVRIARRLIASGADVNAAGFDTGYTAPNVTQMFDEHEWRPLEGAAGRAVSLALVQALLEAGADPAQTQQALSFAVQGGDLEILHALLAAGPRGWWQVRWALKACVVLDRLDMARAIVAASADQDPTQVGPDRALFEAIRLERDPEWVGVLIGSDARVESTLPMRQKAYRLALRHGQRAAADVLRQRGASDSEVTVVDRVIAACVTLDRAELRRLLAEPEATPIAFRDDDHRMLPWAIRRNRHEAVPLLLEAGLDPNVADVDGDTPLHLAARAGAAALVEVLLRAGAKSDATNFDGQTPFQTAVARSAERDARFEEAADAVAAGDVAALRQLLDRDPSLARARSPRPHRATLLIYCGANGVEDLRQRTPATAPAVAQLLLERGADPNAACKLYGGGATTVGLLLTSAHPKNAGVNGDLLAVLARFGARLSGGDLHTAIDSGAPRAARAIADAGVPVNTLFAAAGLDRVDLLADLLARGEDVNRRWTGWASTALHAAAANGHAASAVFLLERGADPGLRNVWGGTPAGTARFFGHADLARAIEAFG